MGVSANRTIIRGKENGYPSGITDGYLVYNGTGTSVTVEGLSLTTTQYCYRAWSENGYGVSLDYAQAQIGGNMILLGLFAFMGVALTFGFFWKRSGFFAYGAAGAWALLGFQSFITSSGGSPIPITDTYMGLFWMCIVFVIACVLLPTIMREKPSPDDLSVDEIDEVTGEPIKKPPPREPKPKQTQFAKRGEV
jgi:hypothetical protein